MKRSVIIVAAVLLVCLLVVLLMVASVVYTPQYETTDIADYGHYKGNYDNKSVQNYIASFFPERIESNFADVTYSYRAQKGDAYAYEAYLSFSIENKKEFEDFIKLHTESLEAKPFAYDHRYVEYTAAAEFLPEQNETQSSVRIPYAKIGKILCNTEENKVIFVALGVYDGGLVKTEFLSVYFNRFAIDPLEYAKHAVPARTKQ